MHLYIDVSTSSHSKQYANTGHPRENHHKFRGDGQHSEQHERFLREEGVGGEGQALTTTAVAAAIITNNVRSGSG